MLALTLGAGAVDFGPGPGLQCLIPEERAADEHRIVAWFAMRSKPKNTIGFTNLAYTCYPMGGPTTSTTWTRPRQPCQHRLLEHRGRLANPAAPRPDEG